MNSFKSMVNAFGGLSREGSEGRVSAREMKNMCITEQRGLNTREALRELSQTVGEAIVYLWRGRLSSGEICIAVTENQFFRFFTQTGKFLFMGYHTSGSFSFFTFNDRLYILTGNEYYCTDGISVSPVVGYVPLVAVSCPPGGGGTPYERVNMLSTYRRRSFSPDGTSKTFSLSENDLALVQWVKVGGETLEATQYTTDTAAGTVIFTTAPAKGDNTVEICYRTKNDNSDWVKKCTGGCAFGSGNDTRVFLFGDPSNPNRRIHSEVGDGMPRADYFPETNYTLIPSGRITSIIRHYDRQLIFCDNSAFFSVDELLQDSLGMYYHSFPVYSLNSAKGHMLDRNSATLIDNCPVTVAADGVYRWVNTSVRDERNAELISDRVEPQLRPMIEAIDTHPLMMLDAEDRRELWIYNDEGKALIWNYSIDEWYYYELPDVTCACETDFGMVFGTLGGKALCFDGTMTKDHGTTDIDSCYETHYLSFGSFDVKKSICEMKVVVRPEVKIHFRLKTFGDGDAKTGTVCTFTREASEGDAGLCRLRRRVRLRRFQGMRFRIEGAADGGVRLLAVTFEGESG